MIEILKGKVVPQKVNEGQDMFNQIYNPDVLLCLANLSNDEVFTPPEVVNQMLDLLPQELFEDPNMKFLDPACKSGVFLREIAKRLIKGLEDVYPDLEERIDHICKEQLYGIAITELTSLLSRRSVYCSKYPNGPFSIAHFDNVEGNIRFKNSKHEWEGKANVSTFVRGEWVRSWRKCKWCGASEEQFGEENREGLETHAYEFIHTLHPEEIFNMKFDVLICNPPYQLRDNGAKSSAKPIYHLFVQQAKKLNPRYISMIIPARWYAGGKGLDSFREEMLMDGHITDLVDYADSRDCFPGVDVAGGICYFLRKRDVESDCKVTNYLGEKSYTSTRRLNEYDTFVRYSEAADILKKVAAFSEPTMDNMVSARKPFGLDTNVTPSEEGELSLRYSKGVGKISRNKVTAGNNMINKWKTIVSYAGYEHAGQPDTDGSRRVLSIIEVIPPNYVCSETYLVAGVFDSEEEANNLQLYLKGKFARFLAGLRVVSQHVTRSTFAFVPEQDFTKQWTDEELYKKYKLTQDEIDFIERLTKPMPEKKG